MAISLKPKKVSLHLAKPNMQIITKLSEAYNIKYDEKLTELSELSFSIPFRVDNYLDITPNENIPLVKEKYLVKLTYNGKTQWFEIDEITDSANDIDTKDVHCFLLPKQLSDKNIRLYDSETSKNADDILVELLEESVWGVGYVDSLYSVTTYRNIQIDSATLLDAIIQVAESFNALIVWDTVNRTVNFYQPQNIGRDTGMTFSYRKYLQSLSQETKIDGMVTRLKVYGKDGLTINSANPLGTNFIEDFSYFMYPFSQDGSGNVLTHSDYMSDELCKAIINHNKLISDNQTNFATYTANLKTYQTDMTTLNNQMSVLKNDLTIIQQALDRANSLGDTTTASAKITEKNNKQTEINNKQTEINNKQIQIDGVNTQINNLKNTLSIESNFTPQLITERNLYIIEKEATDDNITNVDDLYKMAQDKILEMKTPVISATINIVNFKEMITESDNWDRLEIGDIVRARHEITGIDIKAKVIGISYDFEGKSISLTISNVKKTTNKGDMLLDLLYKSASTSNTVSMNKFKWDVATNIQDTVDAWFNDQFDATKQTITAGINNSVEISGKGILIKNSDSPLNMLIAQNGVLALTNDGGNTWKTAIKPTGVVAEQIAGKLIVGINLSMENESGKFKFDKNGVTIDGSSLTVTGGIKESQLDPALSFIKSGTDYNGVKIDSTNGIVITKSNNKSKTILNATNGILISKSSDGTNWTNVFSVDTNGDLNITGNITMNGGSINWGAITKPTYTASDVGAVSNSQTAVFNTLTNNGTLGGLFMSGGQLYINASYINAGTISGDKISGGTITGTIISGVNINGSNITSKTDVATNSYVELYYNELRFWNSGTLMMRMFANSGSSNFQIVPTNNISVAGQVNASSFSCYNGIYVSSGSSTFYGNVTVMSGYTLDAQAITIAGSSVATQSYVNSNYIGSSWFNSQGYATQSWVTSQNYTPPFYYGNVYRDGYGGNGTYTYIGSPNEVRVTNHNFGSGSFMPIRASSFPTGSSIKFKDNLVKIEDTDISPLELIENTQIWQYHLKSNLEARVYDKPKIGVITEMISPVFRDEDGIDPYTMISLAWQSIKELSKELKEAKERIATLEELI